MIYNSIIETVGNTPLVRLNKVGKGIEGNLIAKIEYFNPGNSVKDRIALKMIEEAEKKGYLKPGGTVIEGTSGNTGVGLALAALAKGYKCIFTMSDKQSKEKVDVLRSLGAEVIICPSNVGTESPESYCSVAKKLNQDIPNSFHLNQYDNIANSEAHYESTGPEIWEQTQGEITHYVAALGTGGSMSGTAKYLKEKKPAIRSIGIDAYGSLLKKYKETNEIDEREIFPYFTEGIGEDVLTDNLNFDVIDQVVKVSDKDGAIMARRLAKEEGLFVGWSSGTIVHGALEYARDNLKKGHNMVFLLPDHGTRYLKKIYNDDWMAENGFFEHPCAMARDIIEQNGSKKLSLTVSEKATVKEAVSLMSRQETDQIPVVDNGQFVGSITTANLLEKLVKDPDLASALVKDVMGEPMRFVSKNATLDTLHAIFKKKEKVLLVGDLDENIYMITEHDLLKKIIS